MSLACLKAFGPAILEKLAIRDEVDKNLRWPNAERFTAQISAKRTTARPQEAARYDDIKKDLSPTQYQQGDRLIGDHLRQVDLCDLGPHLRFVASFGRSTMSSSKK